MKLHTKLIILLTLIIAGLLTSCSNDDNDVNPMPNGIETSEQLSAYLSNLADENDVPGFSISVAINNSIAFQNSFGYANISNQTAYSNQTVNGIASISKTFVGAATAKAIEQGYFTLDTNINDVLPIEINNPNYPNSPIKIKHLVTHTSGIIDVPEAYISGDYYILEGEDITTTAAGILINSLGIQQQEAVELEDYLAEIFMEDGDLTEVVDYLNAEPGEQWMYSNMATSLMGYIIEYVTEEPFMNYVETYVLNPLQMSNSTYDIYEVNTSNLAIQYINVNQPLPRYGNHGYAEGSMHTNNTDLAKYLLDMMKGKRGESSVLFSSEYYELLFNEKLSDGIVPTEFADNHGLFWYMKDENLIHGGNSLGVSSHLQFKQDGSSGYFILSNMDGTFYENEPKWLEVKTLISEAIEQFVANN